MGPNTIRRHRIILVLLFVVVILAIITYGFKGTSISIYKTTKQTISKLLHKQTPEQISGAHDILILTYMRSGSTFVGKILGWREDTFYWFEPLWKQYPWSYLTADRQICSYKNSTCKSDSNNNSVEIENSLEFLSDVYSCNNLSRYYKHFTIGIEDDPLLAGPTGASFSNCTKRQMLCQGSCDVYGAINKDFEKECEQCQKICYANTMEMCLKAKHRVTKVLRMDASLARLLLEKHKNLKLVQIFRDPRAIISSRIQSLWYYDEINTPEKDAEILCKRIEKDLKAAEYLAVRFPNRVMVLQYEDFYDPKQLALNLYNFAGMDIEPGFNTRTFNTHTDIFNSFMKKLTGNVAGFHPDKYRSSLQWKLVKVINHSCYRVIKKMGLRLFESEEQLRNLSLDSVMNSMPYALN